MRGLRQVLRFVEELFVERLAGPQAYILDGDVLTGELAGETDHLIRQVCQVPRNYIPKRSNPLLQAREVLRLLAEEGIEGSGKEAEPQGDGD